MPWVPRSPRPSTTPSGNRARLRSFRLPRRATRAAQEPVTLMFLVVRGISTDKNSWETRMTRCRTLAALLLAPLLVALTASAAMAQSYPNKPVRLVLPYAPGGIIDYVGRTLAQHLSEPLGQPVVAENRPGAGGIAGTDTVARSTPDGYTIVIMDPAIVINPTLQPSMPYDLFKQLTTVSIVSSSP